MKEKINCVAALIMSLSIAATLSALIMRGVYAIILLAGNEKINPSLDMTWMIVSYCALGVSIVSGIVVMFTDKNSTIITPTENHIAYHNEEVQKISRALDDAQKIEALTAEIKNKDDELIKAKTDLAIAKKDLATREEECEGERVKMFSGYAAEVESSHNKWIEQNWKNIEIVSRKQTSSAGSWQVLSIFYKKKPKPEPYPMDMATA